FLWQFTIIGRPLRIMGFLCVAAMSRFHNDLAPVWPATCQPALVVCYFPLELQPGVRLWECVDNRSAGEELVRFRRPPGTGQWRHGRGSGDSRAAGVPLPRCRR